MSSLVTRNGHASLQLMHAGGILGLALIMCLLVPEYTEREALGECPSSINQARPHPQSLGCDRFSNWLSLRTSYHSYISQLLSLIVNLSCHLYRTAKYFSRIMPSTKPTHKAHPVTSVPPISPRAEDNQGYRRGRAIRSCLECRRRKMRCNRSRPCQNCNRFCRDCVYHPFPEWPSGAPNTSREDSSVRSPVQGGGRAFPSFDTTQNFGYVQPPPFSNHDYNYTPDPLAKTHKYYEADADDDALDVALQIGRLSITEKLGGYFRPHIATQVSLVLSCWCFAVLCFFNTRVTGIATSNQH